MMQKKIALLTGATGFIGSRLTIRLIQEGWEVHVLIRENSSLYELASVSQKIQTHIYKGITEDLIQIIRNISPNIVFHLASLFIARHQSEDINGLIDSNLKFPTQLLEAMAINNIQYFINTGTSWEYYNSNEYNPVCLYSATKHAFESIIEYYVQVHELRAITLKLFDTYGVGDPRKKIISLLNRVANSDESFAMSPGQQEIDLVYIDDVIDMYLLVASEIVKMEPQQKYYDVTSGNPITLKELVARFENTLGKKLNIKWGKLPYRDREVMQSQRKMNLFPGWQPKTSLNNGLKEVVDSCLGKKKDA
jgi:nucleoside-diphosphate-sugar epimerase